MFKRSLSKKEASYLYNSHFTNFVLFASIKPTHIPNLATSLLDIAKKLQSQNELLQCQVVPSATSQSGYEFVMTHPVPDISVRIVPQGILENVAEQELNSEIKVCGEAFMRVSAVVNGNELSGLICCFPHYCFDGKAGM